MSSIKNFVLILSFCYTLVHCTEGFNKYSEESNNLKYNDPLQFGPSLRELDKPFRMAKLNILWSKAKVRLTDTKLQSIFSDIKLHDQEEIAYKHYKSSGNDPEGKEEANLRKKLIGIMSTYGLLEHFVDTDDPNLLKKHKALNDGISYVAKDIFKDKRLNKLWVKAQMGGFTEEELEALKEEFGHHQDKIDEYMNLLKDVQVGDTDTDENSIHEKPEEWYILKEDKYEESADESGKKLNYVAKAKQLREKHIQLRNGYDRLDRLTAQGPNQKGFIDPQVQALWRVVLDTPFSPEERASLKKELLHYERRLLKLRHLHIQAALDAAKQEKDDLNDSTTHHIKKHARTVQKLQLDLESKIMQRHSDL